MTGKPNRWEVSLSRNIPANKQGRNDKIRMSPLSSMGYESSMIGTITKKIQPDIICNQMEEPVK